MVFRFQTFKGRESCASAVSGVSDLMWGRAVCGTQVSGWDAWWGTQEKKQVGKEVGRGWVM